MNGYPTDDAFAAAMGQSPFSGYNNISRFTPLMPADNQQKFQMIQPTPSIVPQMAPIYGNQPIAPQSTGIPMTAQFPNIKTTSAKKSQKTASFAVPTTSTVPYLIDKIANYKINCQMSDDSPDHDLSSSLKERTDGLVAISTPFYILIVNTRLVQIGALYKIMKKINDHIIYNKQQTTITVKYSGIHVESIQRNIIEYSPAMNNSSLADHLAANKTQNYIIKLDPSSC